MPSCTGCRLTKNSQLIPAVTIGPNAKKPLQIKMPIMITGMAYGLALSAKTKIALAKGSSLAGTATNTGEGAFLPAERKAANKLIIQYSRGEWTKSEDVFRQADAVEIHLGQGAGAGVGSIIPSKELTWTSKRAMGVKWGKRAFIHSTIPGMWHKNQMPRLVSLLREVSGGVPVGIKMAASKYIEKDLEIALGAGVDYIVLDGAQAGTKGSPSHAAG
ncbi:MAG: glutamate synthase-related protein [Bacillota bacterium]